METIDGNCGRRQESKERDEEKEKGKGKRKMKELRQNERKGETRER